jgi:hydrogenase expression/formation protein HypD
VSGFEPVDILQSIYMLAQQKENNLPETEIEYTRAVSREGNKKAQSIIEEVFELRDDWWRGFGIIEKSGLGIRDKYALWDAEKMLSVEVEETVEEVGCICGIVLKGTRTPRQCHLFDKECTPANPVGACMVSSEGACHAYFKYRNEN